MSSRNGLIAAMVALEALRAWAAVPGWEGFVEGSDRSANPAIIQLVSTSDFAEKKALLSAIGRRAEPYAGDIIESLASGYLGREEFKGELLLRILLDSLFSTALPPSTRADRIQANREALGGIVLRLTHFSDPQLAGVIVQIIPDLGQKQYFPILSEQAAILIARMEKQKGELSPMDTDLLLALLDCFIANPSADFLEICLTAARISRNEATVSRSRSAAAAIAAALH